MDTNTLRNRAVIAGIGNTEYSSASGCSELRLGLEACLAAIADAGVDRPEIDGLARFGVSQTGASEAWMATNLGLRNLSYWESVDYGGTAAPALIGHAAAAVACGLAKYVLCYRTSTVDPACGPARATPTSGCCAVVTPASTTSSCPTA